MLAETTGHEPALLSRRLIAFCDIIGFTNRLKTSRLRDLHEMYSRLIDHANSKIFQQEAAAGSPEHRNFARADFLFDSVLLVSNHLTVEEAPHSVSDFMSALSQLFESSLGWQLPLRGAISLGDVLEDTSRRISLSETIPDLVGAEKQQEWAGVRILGPAVDAIIDGLYGTAASEIPKSGTGHVVSYPVPTKHGTVPSLVLNWPYLCDAKDIKAGLAFLIGRKGEETQRFVDFVHSLLPPPTRLPSRVGTIESVRIRFYQSGFNIKFCDADGNGADPPEGTTIDFRIAAQRIAPIPSRNETD
jgi:hypothetical protein